MVNFKKIPAIIIAILFFVCLGSLMYLNEHYAYTRPEHPQPEIGRIYSLDVHGTVVYLTKREDSQLQWLWYSLGALLLIAAVYTYRFHPFDKDRDEAKHLH